MNLRPIVCSDCDTPHELDRRTFLKGVAIAGVAAAGGPALQAAERLIGPKPGDPSETAVAALYKTLTDAQKKAVCFDWDYVDPKRGLLRTFVANNWHITKPTIEGEFFTKKQRLLIRDVFDGLFHADWREKIVKQLKDDTEGHPWGADQNIAIFGKPGEGKSQFVMTGRHMTIRADGNSEDHVAFGGPIFHGHAADGFDEKPTHPGNIFWPQAVLANQLCGMLDGKQREQALIQHRPEENDIAFRKDRRGIQVSDLSRDQKEMVGKVLAGLIEPYREDDRAEVRACMEKAGGLDVCNLSFFKEADLGDDGVWDNWRLQGPAVTWYFRGSPHVHIWIRVADDPTVKLNEKI